jgi:hypothetical protein
MINHYKSFFDDATIPGFWSIKMKEKKYRLGNSLPIGKPSRSFSICCFLLTYLVVILLQVLLLRLLQVLLLRLLQVLLRLRLLVHLLATLEL